MKASTIRAVGSLNRLFRPASIAVVGASASPDKLGSVMFKAVRGSRDPDLAVYAVNPKSPGEAFLPSLQAATEVHGTPLDLVVSCIPAPATPALIQQAAECGAGAAVICAGGFSEAGAAGRELQQRLALISSAGGVRLLGPNTSGFFRPESAIVSFVPGVEQIRSGRVAVVAASGGMNHALSYLLSESGTGVALGVGLGNCVDVTMVDVLDYLREDDTVAAVAVHVESVDDGQDLLSAVDAVSERKPVVALVVGRTDVSAFAESHTGALATSWRTARALLAQAGAVVVDNECELVDAATVLSNTRLTANAGAAGIGLVTAQAGPGLLVLDQLQAHRVAVPTLAATTQSALATYLPPLTFQANPVDTGRPGATFGQVLATTASDPSIDALAVYALAEPDAIDIADAVHRSGVQSQVPVIIGVGGSADDVDKIKASTRAIGVPVLTTPTALANGVRALVSDARTRRVNHPADAFHDDGRDPAISLPAHEAAAKDLLDALGISTPPRRICADRRTAHRALVELSAPVVVKILDAAIQHKTDVDGVHLGVCSPAELDAALDALDSISAPAYLVERMAKPGVDLIVGARRDPTFGPIVLTGLGGTAAEAIGDVAIRSHTVSLTGAAEMLDDLQCAALLRGWRGGPVVNRGEFGRIIVTLIRYLAAHPEIGDIEINPLRCTFDGLVALDATITPVQHPGDTREGTPR